MWRRGHRRVAPELVPPPLLGSGGPPQGVVDGGGLVVNCGAADAGDNAPEAPRGVGATGSREGGQSGGGSAASDDAAALMLGRGDPRRVCVGLHEAIQRGQVHAVRELSARYASGEKPHAAGWRETPLMVACQAYHLPDRIQYDIVETLLKNGHAIDDVDSSGRSALALAILAAPRDASALPAAPRFPPAPIWCRRGDAVLIRRPESPRIWSHGTIVSRGLWDGRDCTGTVLYSVKVARRRYAGDNGSALPPDAHRSHRDANINSNSDVAHAPPSSYSIDVIEGVTPNSVVMDAPPLPRHVSLGVVVLVNTAPDVWQSGVIVAMAARGGYEVSMDAPAAAAAAAQQGASSSVATRGGDVAVDDAAGHGEDAPTAAASAAAPGPGASTRIISGLRLADLRLPCVPQPIEGRLPATEGVLYPGKPVVYLPPGGRQFHEGIVQQRNTVDGGYDVLSRRVDGAAAVEAGWGLAQLAAPPAESEAEEQQQQHPPPATPTHPLSVGGGTINWIARLQRRLGGGSGGANAPPANRPAPPDLARGVPLSRIFVVPGASFSQVCERIVDLLLRHAYGGALRAVPGMPVGCFAGSPLANPQQPSHPASRAAASLSASTRPRMRGPSLVLAAAARDAAERRQQGVEQQAMWQTQASGEENGEDDGDGDADADAVDRDSVDGAPTTAPVAAAATADASISTNRRAPQHLGWPLERGVGGGGGLFFAPGAATPPPDAGTTLSFVQTAIGGHTVALAAWTGRLGVLRTLYSHGAITDHPDTLDDWYNSVKAVDFASDPDVVLFFVRCGAAYPLAKAAALSKTRKFGRWVEVLREILARADPEDHQVLFESRYPSDAGLTALGWACMLGNFPALRAMVGAAADSVSWRVPFRSDPHHPLALFVKSPIPEAAQDRAVSWMLENHPEAVTSEHLSSALAHAIAEGCEQLVAYLLRRGGDPHCTALGIMPYTFVRHFGTYIVLMNHAQRVELTPVEFVERLMRASGGSFDTGGRFTAYNGFTSLYSDDGASSPRMSKVVGLARRITRILNSGRQRRQREEAMRAFHTAAASEDLSGGQPPPRPPPPRYTLRVTRQRLGWWQVFAKAAKQHTHDPGYMWDGCNREGHTALTLAIALADVDIVRMLLHPGRANVNIPTAHGEFPIDIALRVVIAHSAGRPVSQAQELASPRRRSRAASPRAVLAAYDTATSPDLDPLLGTLLQADSPPVEVLGTCALVYACELPDERVLCALLAHVTRHSKGKYFQPTWHGAGGVPGGRDHDPPHNDPSCTGDRGDPPAQLLYRHPLLQAGGDGLTVMHHVVRRGWVRVFEHVQVLPRLPEGLLLDLFNSTKYATMAEVLRRAPVMMLKVAGRNLLRTVLERSATCLPGARERGCPTHLRLCEVVELLLERMPAGTVRGTGTLFVAALRNNADAIIAMTAKLKAAGLRWAPEAETGTVPGNPSADGLSASRLSPVMVATDASVQHLLVDLGFLPNLADLARDGRYHLLLHALRKFDSDTTGAAAGAVGLDRAQHRRAYCSTLSTATIQDDAGALCARKTMLGWLVCRNYVLMPSNVRRQSEQMSPHVARVAVLGDGGGGTAPAVLSRGPDAFARVRYTAQHEVCPVLYALGWACPFVGDHYTRGRGAVAVEVQRFSHLLQWGRRGAAEVYDVVALHDLLFPVRSPEPIVEGMRVLIPYRCCAAGDPSTTAPTEPPSTSTPAHLYLKATVLEVRGADTPATRVPMCRVAPHTGAAATAAVWLPTAQCVHAQRCAMMGFAKARDEVLEAAGSSLDVGSGQDVDGMSLFELACARGDLGAVGWCCASGLMDSATEDQLEAGVCRAAQSAHHDAVKYLLESETSGRFANACQARWRGLGLGHYVKTEETILFIIGQWANGCLFPLDRTLVSLPLYAAQGWVRALRALLYEHRRFDLDVNATDDRGRTALHAAAEHAQREVFAELIKHERIELDARTCDGETVLTIAARAASRKNPAVACAIVAMVCAKVRHPEQLLQRGHALCTALAQDVPSVDLVRVMLKCGARVDDARRGRSALQHIGTHGSEGDLQRRAQSRCAVLLIDALLQWDVEVTNPLSEYCGRTASVVRWDHATGKLTLKLHPGAGAKCVVVGEGDDEEADVDADAAVRFEHTIVCHAREARTRMKGPAAGGRLAAADFMHVVKMAWPAAVRALVHRNALQGYTRNVVPHLRTDTLKNALMHYLGVLREVWQHGGDGDISARTAASSGAPDEWYALRALLGGLYVEHSGGEAHAGRTARARAGVITGFRQAVNELTDAAGRETLAKRLPLAMFREGVWEGEAVFLTPQFGRLQFALKQDLCRARYSALTRGAGWGDAAAATAAASDAVDVWKAAAGVDTDTPAMRRAARAPPPPPPAPLRVFQTLHSQGTELPGWPSSLELAVEYGWAEAVAWLLREGVDANTSHSADRPIRIISQMIHVRHADVVGQALRAFDEWVAPLCAWRDTRQLYVDYMRLGDTPGHTYPPPVHRPMDACVLHACTAHPLLRQFVHVAQLLLQHGANAEPDDLQRLGRVMRLDHLFDAVIHGRTYRGVSLLHIAAACNNASACRWLLSAEAYAHTLALGTMADDASITARQYTTSHECHALLTQREQATHRAVGSRPDPSQVDTVVVIKTATEPTVIQPRELLCALGTLVPGVRRFVSFERLTRRCKRHHVERDLAMGAGAFLHAVNALDLSGAVVAGNGRADCCTVRRDVAREEEVYCLVSSGRARREICAARNPNLAVIRPVKNPDAGVVHNTRECFHITKHILGEFTWPVPQQALQGAAGALLQAVLLDSSGGAAAAQAAGNRADQGRTEYQLSLEDRHWVLSGTWRHYGRWVKYPAAIVVRVGLVEGRYRLVESATGAGSMFRRGRARTFDKRSYPLYRLTVKRGGAQATRLPRYLTVDTYGVWKFIADRQVVLSCCARSPLRLPLGLQYWQGRRAFTHGVLLGREWAAAATISSPRRRNARRRRKNDNRRVSATSPSSSSSDSDSSSGSSSGGSSSDSDDLGYVKNARSVIMLEIEVLHDAAGDAAGARTSPTHTPTTNRVDSGTSVISGRGRWQLLERCGDDVYPYVLDRAPPDLGEPHVMARRLADVAARLDDGMPHALVLQADAFKPLEGVYVKEVTRAAGDDLGLRWWHAHGGYVLTVEYIPTTAAGSGSAAAGAGGGLGGPGSHPDNRTARADGTTGSHAGSAAAPVWAGDGGPAGDLASHGRSGANGPPPPPRGNEEHTVHIAHWRICRAGRGGDAAAAVMPTSMPGVHAHGNGRSGRKSSMPARSGFVVESTALEMKSLDRAPWHIDGCGTWTNAEWGTVVPGIRFHVVDGDAGGGDGGVDTATTTAASSRKKDAGKAPDAAAPGSATAAAGGIERGQKLRGIAAGGGNDSDDENRGLADTNAAAAAIASPARAPSTCRMAMLNRKVRAMWGVRQILLAAGVNGDELPFKGVTRLPRDVACVYTPPNLATPGNVPPGQTWMDLLLQKRRITCVLPLHNDTERREISETWIPDTNGAPLRVRDYFQPWLWQPFRSLADFVFEDDARMARTVRYDPRTGRLYTRKDFLAEEPLSLFNASTWETLCELDEVDVRTPLFRQKENAYYSTGLVEDGKTGKVLRGTAASSGAPAKIACADVAHPGDCLLVHVTGALWARVDRPVAQWWVPFFDPTDPSVAMLERAGDGQADMPFVVRALRDVPYYSEDEREVKVKDAAEVLPAGAVVGVRYLSLDGAWALVAHHEHKIYFKRFWAPLKTRDGRARTLKEPYLDALTRVQRYFGSKAAFYYAFTAMYCSYLGFLCCTGIMFTAVQAMVGPERAADVVVWNTVVVIAWASLFSRRWERKSSELAYLWNVRNVEMWEPPMPEYFKRNAHAERRPHPITGVVEPYIPDTQRFFSYAQSVVVCLSWAVLVVVIMYFNVELREQHTGYDPNRNEIAEVFLQLLFSIEAALCVAVLDYSFSYVVVWLNVRENHRSLSKMQASAITKNFLFRFVNGFSGLLITAFRRAGPVCECAAACHYACREEMGGVDASDFDLTSCPSPDAIQQCIHLARQQSLMILLATLLVVQALLSTAIEKILPKIVVEAKVKQMEKRTGGRDAFPECLPARHLQALDGGALANRIVLSHLSMVVNGGACSNSAPTTGSTALSAWRDRSAAAINTAAAAAPPAQPPTVYHILGEGSAGGPRGHTKHSEAARGGRRGRPVGTSAERLKSPTLAASGAKRDQDKGSDASGASTAAPHYGGVWVVDEDEAASDDDAAGPRSPQRGVTGRIGAVKDLFLGGSGTSPGARGAGQGDGDARTGRAAAPLRTPHGVVFYVMHFEGQLTFATRQVGSGSGSGSGCGSGSGSGSVAFAPLSVDSDGLREAAAAAVTLPAFAAALEATCTGESRSEFVVPNPPEAPEAAGTDDEEDAALEDDGGERQGDRVVGTRVGHCELHDVDDARPRRWLLVSLCAVGRDGLQLELLDEDQQQQCSRRYRVLRLKRVSQVFTARVSGGWGECDTAAAASGGGGGAAAADHAHTIYAAPPMHAPLLDAGGDETGMSTVERGLAAFMTSGGFMDLDARHRLLRLRCGHGVGPHDDADLAFLPAVDWPPELTAPLWEAGRFQPVREPALRYRGARYAAWLLPLEEVEYSRAGGKRLWSAPAGGAFAMLFANDEDADSAAAVGTLPDVQPPPSPLNRYYAVNTTNTDICHTVRVEMIKPAPSDSSDFDDYTLMMLQFAYVICFAPVLPLAPMVAIVTAVVELHADLYRSMHLNQRRDGRKASGIGAWLTLMQVIVYISIPLNIAIGITGRGWDLYTGDADMTEAFFILIAGGVLLVIVVAVAVGSTAGWVSEYEVRKEYEALQGSADAVAAKK